MAMQLLDGQESERLYFRKVLPSDFNTWLPFFYDTDSTKYWDGIPTDPKQACKEQFDCIFERYRNNLGGMNALILKEKNNLVGFCGLLLQEVDGVREWEIGYALLSKYRKQGFATEAAKKCKDYAFENRLTSSLISIIQIHNIPSQKVALNNGMQNTKETIYKDNPVYLFRVTVPKTM